MQVRIVLIWHIAKRLKRFDVVNIQSAFTFFLWLPAVLAFVAIALSGRALLCMPVWAIVVNGVAATPRATIRTDKVFGLPSGLTCPTTASRYSADVFGIEAMKYFATPSADMFRRAAFVTAVVIAALVARLPHADARHATKLMLATLRLIWLAFKRFAAHLAYDRHRAALPVRILFTGSLACLRGSKPSRCIQHACAMGAATQMLRSLDAVRLDLERRSAHRATHCNHTYSLTRADNRGWGKPVSVAGGSKRFMRPFLSLMYYTIFRYRTLQNDAIWYTPVAIDATSKVSERKARRGEGEDRRARTHVLLYAYGGHS